MTANGIDGQTEAHRERQRVNAVMNSDINEEPEVTKGMKSLSSLIQS